jgi:hypothetical protein
VFVISLLIVNTGGIFLSYSNIAKLLNLNSPSSIIKLKVVLGISWPLKSSYYIFLRNINDLNSYVFLIPSSFVNSHLSTSSNLKLVYNLLSNISTLITNLS